MKKIPCFFSLLFLSCAVQKQPVNYIQVYSKHIEPYHVFSVGNWTDGYFILTLTDANNEYFNIVTNSPVAPKRGDVYKP
jgi:hypothetical protein